MSMKNVSQHTRQPTNSPLGVLADVLALSHIYNGIGSACAVAIGFLVTAWYWKIGVNIGPLAGAAAATLCVSNGGFIINDIFDLPIDRVNRPDRPLAAGRISLTTAWAFYGIYTLLGIALAILVSPLIVALSITTALGLFLYSFAIKKRFIIGHLLIAVLGAVLLPFGGLACGYLVPTVYTIPVTLLAFFAREILKTVPDVEGDRANGVVNISTRFGPTRATNLAKMIMIAAAVTLPLLRLIWTLNIGFLVVVVIVIWPVSFITAFAPQPASVQVRRLLRVSKLLFLLVAVALLIGSIQ